MKTLLKIGILTIVLNIFTGWIWCVPMINTNVNNPTMESVLQSTTDKNDTISHWTPELIEKIKQVEIEYNLPHGIFRAFNLKENSGRIGNKAEPRVESGFFNVGERHYKDVMKSTQKFFDDNPEMIDSIPFDVERFQQATSFGSVQLMGFNIRALGYKGKFMSDITNEEFFVLWAKFFKGYLNRFGSLQKAISMYNGPKAPASYARDVIKYMKKFSY